MRWVTKSQQERLLSCLDPLRTGLAGRLPWWMDKLQLTWICFVRRPKHLKRPSPFFAFIFRMRNNFWNNWVSTISHHIPRKSCAQTLACLWPRSTTCLGHLNSFRGSRSVPAPEFMVETSTRDVAPSKGWETSGWRSKMCTSMWYTIWNQHFINSQVCTPWLIFEAAL